MEISDPPPQRIAREIRDHEAEIHIPQKNNGAPVNVAHLSMVYGGSIRQVSEMLLNGVTSKVSSDLFA